MHFISNIFVMMVVDFDQVKKNQQSVTFWIRDSEHIGIQKKIRE